MAGVQFIGSSNPEINGDSGDIFFLNNIDSTTVVSNNSNSLMFIVGQNQSLDLVDTGSETIFDLGQGLDMERDVSANLHGTEDVFGFQFDKTGSMQFFGSGMTTAQLAATIQPDGHGGTLVGPTGYQFDLIGDMHLDPAQVSAAI